MKKVAVIMGSDSDLKVMQDAVDMLVEFGIPNIVDIVSAHRTPEYMFDFAKNAAKNDIAVIIAGAGGAAHLPGMVASLTHLPVIGVPVKSSNSIDGWDSVLSILQMPNGRARSHRSAQCPLRMQAYWPLRFWELPMNLLPKS
jgi:5-(carboxyamino)imidazole ribonucleotide mutase